MTMLRASRPLLLDGGVNHGDDDDDDDRDDDAGHRVNVGYSVIVSLGGARFWIIEASNNW